MSYDNNDEYWIKKIVEQQQNLIERVVGQLLAEVRSAHADNKRIAEEMGGYKRQAKMFAESCVDYQEELKELRKE